jgi:hypothetical protein
MLIAGYIHNKVAFALVRWMRHSRYNASLLAQCIEGFGKTSTMFLAINV